MCITSEKGHANEHMVRQGQVREVDRVENDKAFGRRRVGPDVVHARRVLSGVCWWWYPVVHMVHRFFIAISQAVVNDDGSAGTAPHPLVCSAGGLPKRRRVVHAVRGTAVLPWPALLGG